MKFRPNIPALRPISKMRWIAFIVALPIFLGAGMILAVGQHGAMEKGNLIAGHTELACVDCHKEQPGTLRQEIQANLKYALGQRETFVPIGYHAADTATCLDCHTRKNDRHPVYRFQEPRFTQAVAQIDARDCLSCHTEHEGQRVSLDDTGFCVACHTDLTLKSDPLNIPHTTLIAQKDWNSCLGCHDFHGNHAYTVPTHTQDQFSAQDIADYLGAGPDPYAPSKIEKGKSP